MYSLIVIPFYFCMFSLVMPYSYEVYRYYNKINYYSDNVIDSDKKKLITVARELIMEAFLKIRQVAGIKNDYSREQAFEVGLIMGNIREKYRRMLETYREMRDQFNNRTYFLPPFMWLMRPILVIVSMEQVHGLETDIDKSIHILETIKDERLNPDMRYTTTRPRKFLRSKENLTLEHRKHEMMMLKEEALKKMNREKQLLRRIGANARHTAMPRFKHQWPVEEAWRLGQYGDLNRDY